MRGVFACAVRGMPHARAVTAPSAASASDAHRALRRVDRAPQALAEAVRNRFAHSKESFPRKHFFVEKMLRNPRGRVQLRAVTDAVEKMSKVDVDIEALTLDHDFPVGEPWPVASETHVFRKSQ